MDLERSLQQRGRAMEDVPYIRERWKLLRPMTPLEIQIDPCPAHLIGAAAASASFPPLIGPLTLKVGDEETYWHAGGQGGDRQPPAIVVERGLVMGSNSWMPPSAISDKRDDHPCLPASGVVRGPSRPCQP